MGKIIFFVIAAIAAAVVVYIVWDKVFQSMEKRKYGNVSKGLLLWQRLEGVQRKLGGHRLVANIAEEISLRLSVFNTLSYDKNLTIAYIAILTTFVAIIAIFAITNVIFFPLWYVALFFSCVALGICIMVFLVFSSLSVQSLLKHMPETIKILNSRFSSRGSIVKAFAASINDFHRSIRGEMVRIYDALKQNDTGRIRETFNSIDKKYRNEHMSLLLELIWFAHYNGGDKVIKEQFEEMTKDVIDDMENRQDLRAASTSYIVMALVFMAGIPLIRIFNGKILEGNASDYYSSREGLILMILYILILMLLVGILIFTERTE